MCDEEERESHVHLLILRPGAKSLVDDGKRGKFTPVDRVGTDIIYYSDNNKSLRGSSKPHLADLDSRSSLVVFAVGVTETAGR